MKKVKPYFVKTRKERHRNVEDYNLKKQVVSKIMNEYSQYGLDEVVANFIYDLAIQKDVPRDSIYPGMRLIMNNQYGIKDETALEDAMKAIMADSILKTMNSNNK